MLPQLKPWARRLIANFKLARVWSAIGISLLFELAKELLKHRFFGTLNEFINSHVGNPDDWVHPVLEWLFRTPFSLPALVLCGIFFHSYLSSLRKDQPREADTAVGIPEGPNVDALQRIKSAKKARIGFVHYPPFVVAAADDFDQPSGLYVDLIREFLISEGIYPIFEQVRFSSAVRSIVDGEQDIILSIFETPQRKEVVDFNALLHKVSVSGVARFSEHRIRRCADLTRFDLKFVVFRGEIGHEMLTKMGIKENRMHVLDGPSLAAMFGLVADRSADLAIADSLSCFHGLAARGAEGPKLKPVLRNDPLYLCMNGVMIGRGQDRLGSWLDEGLKRLLAEPRFQTVESGILQQYRGIITKI